MEHPIYVVVIPSLIWLTIVLIAHKKYHSKFKLRKVFAFSTVIMLMSILLHIILYLSNYRIQEVFDNNNSLAQFAGMLYLYTLFVRRSNKNTSQIKKGYYIGYVFLALFLFSILATYIEKL